MTPTRLAGLTVILMLAGGVRAHQLHAAITTVLFNPRTGNVEVMHRFYRHDAEHALRLGGGAADLLDNPADRARFASYVHERFGLSGIGAELEPLTLVGAELDGDFLWVYQRTPEPEELQGLSVRFDALRDLWPEQVNTVNVERDGTVRTLTFRGKDGTQSVAF